MFEPHINDAVGDLVATVTSRMDAKAAFSTNLKEALRTIKLGDRAVRIGSWDIVYDLIDGGRVYSVRSAYDEEIILKDICFYDTAMRIVRLLNDGLTVRSTMILDIMMSNDAFARARDEADFQLTRARYFDEQEDFAKSEAAMVLHDYYYDKSQSFYSRVAG